MSPFLNVSSLGLSALQSNFPKYLFSKSSSGLHVMFSLIFFLFGDSTGVGGSFLCAGDSEAGGRGGWGGNHRVRGGGGRGASYVFFSGGKSEKGNNSVKYSENFMKNHSRYQNMSDITIPAQVVLQIFC